jgi:hypothetical protein
MIMIFNDMTITITEKEYTAIAEVLDQVCTDYEAASDEEYIQSTAVAINLVQNVIRKYKKARQRANEFQQARAYVAERNRNRGLRPRDIDRLTRQVLKKINNDTF